MKLEFKLAFKNLFGAKLRTLLNVFVLSFSFVIIIFLNSIMDGWDQQAQKDSVEWEFGEGHLLHNDYDPLDSYTILDGHGEIPKRRIGMTPVLERQASVYPQRRMISIVLKGIPSDQKILKLPTKKLNQNKDELVARAGKSLQKLDSNPLVNQSIPNLGKKLSPYAGANMNSLWATIVLGEWFESLKAAYVD